jgi:hypothetical protein
VFFQPVEGGTESALLRFLHGEFVLFQPVTFRLCFCRFRVLTADVRQFRVTKATSSQPTTARNGNMPLI